MCNMKTHLFRERKKYSTSNIVSAFYMAEQLINLNGPGCDKNIFCSCMTRSILISTKMF